MGGGRRRVGGFRKRGPARSRLMTAWMICRREMEAGSWARQKPPPKPRRFCGCGWRRRVVGGLWRSRWAGCLWRGRGSLCTEGGSRGGGEADRGAAGVCGGVREPTRGGIDSEGRVRGVQRDANRPGEIRVKITRTAASED